ncbi:MAG: anti-sigma factor antagonist [Pseudonocardiales bacterium]|nr:anti-sigma factor antagonist [Pseudonocardiales bacterium]
MITGKTVANITGQADGTSVLGQYTTPQSPPAPRTPPAPWAPSRAPTVPTTTMLLFSATAERLDTRVVAVIGELDIATTPRLAEFLTTHRPTTSTLVLDLSGVTFLSAAGLRVLDRAQQRAHADRTSLRIVSASRCVSRVLRVTELDRELACYPTLRAALPTRPEPVLAR